jgi:hypothetical protein
MASAGGRYFVWIQENGYEKRNLAQGKESCTSKKMAKYSEIFPCVGAWWNIKQMGGEKVLHMSKLRNKR